MYQYCCCPNTNFHGDRSDGKTEQVVYHQFHQCSSQVPSTCSTSHLKSPSNSTVAKPGRFTETQNAGNRHLTFLRRLHIITRDTIPANTSGT
ncbi:hypothetical protein DPMN_128264 [Dreissena polymorpha]|uniref:Uncharacterized protein n=1 Tax=Dreissena polymorpha TaxID=45954 RepID=A0A9D4H0T8_DREPO|nr:hypothetical protein DPMN_128264 [Dreissena polymorpha]